MVLSAFAFGWAAAGASGLPSAPLGWALIAAAAVAALVLGRAAHRTNPLGDDPPPAAMRRFGAVNLAQTVAIAAAVAVSIAAGIETVIPPAVCLIVGLHFVPLAPAFGQPLYRRLAGALGAVAAVGFLVALVWPRATLSVVGFGAALALADAARRLTVSARRHQGRYGPVTSRASGRS